MNIPVTIGDIRTIKDKDDKDVDVIDCVFNPWVIKQANNFYKFKKDVF